MLHLLPIIIISMADVGLVESAKWALLVAGSYGWGNYRHQADIFHAYHLLSSVYDPDHIVVMAVDDIADNPRNPFKGKVFNHPDLIRDVYHSVRGKIDYTGTQVNRSTFLRALEGIKGEGKVIASGETDRVFIFFSDHGAPGILGMPYGGVVFADELFSAIRRKRAAGGFAEMVFYLESCESGSMFQGFDYRRHNVYAVTASSANESSWATYCPGFGPEPSLDTEIGTCIGDLFSVSWMEDLGAHRGNQQEETLEDQFVVAKTRTSIDNTYAMGSHVSQFGAIEIDKEYVGEWEGTGERRGSSLIVHNSMNVHQHTADLLPLRGDELEIELQRRRGIESKAWALSAHFEPLLKQSTARAADTAIVDDWDRYRSLIAEWGEICCSPRPMDSYSLSFAQLLVDLTNLNVSRSTLSEAWQILESETM
jgi:legumain